MVNHRDARGILKARYDDATFGRMMSHLPSGIGKWEPYTTKHFNGSCYRFLEDGTFNFAGGAVVVTLLIGDKMIPNEV